MQRRSTFSARMRLSGKRQFEAVYAAKTRAAAGPLLVYGVPNERTHYRLGLGVPGRVGTNVARNTIKRRLREAFRLMQHELPCEGGGYDVVINVRPHEMLSTCEYQDLLRTTIKALHKSWTRRNPTNQPPPTSSE